MKHNRDFFARPDQGNGRSANNYGLGGKIHPFENDDPYDYDWPVENPLPRLTIIAALPLLWIAAVSLLTAHFVFGVW